METRGNQACGEEEGGRDSRAEEEGTGRLKRKVRGPRAGRQQGEQGSAWDDKRAPAWVLLLQGSEGSSALAQRIRRPAHESAVCMRVACEGLHDAAKLSTGNWEIRSSPMPHQHWPCCSQGHLPRGPAQGLAASEISIHFGSGSTWYRPSTPAPCGRRRYCLPSIDVMASCSLARAPEPRSCDEPSAREKALLKLWGGMSAVCHRGLWHRVACVCIFRRNGFPHAWRWHPRNPRSTTAEPAPRRRELL